MNLKKYLAIIFILITSNIFSQTQILKQLEKRNEAVIKISENDLDKINDIEHFSIDHHHFTKGKQQVYINKKAYKYLKSHNIPFTLATPPSMLYKAKMTNNKAELQNWNSYPTYDAYISMMKNFAESFPNYCKLDTIGFSVQNRAILCVKISDNVNETELNEPKIFYSSSMHGDELVGYVLMLRLTDYLLQNKDSNGIAELINNTEFYINPLSNPDGAYADGNYTVNGATRSNANGVDLNRNFPTVKLNNLSKNYTAKREMEIENKYMVEYMEKHNFTLSINFHGGTEVLNYPWDCFSKRHADDSWFKYVCRAYADTAHTIDPNYMSRFNNGITNGYDWYSFSGGRQDYVTHFLQGREITAELSFSKIPSANHLPSYWNKNYKSLINFAKQAMYGVSGTITNKNNKPLQANVKVLQKDNMLSVTSNTNGLFFRLLEKGSYDFEFTKIGYHTDTLKNIQVTNFKQTKVNISLSSILTDSIVFNKYKITLEKGESIKIIKNTFPANALDTSVTWLSSDTNIVIVNNEILETISVGNATIKAIANDNSGVFATCEIEVVEPEILVKEITLNTNELFLNVGFSKTLTAMVSPTNATDTTITWTSADTTIATVNNGIVTGINVGNTIISAKANDISNIHSNCKITVKETVSANEKTNKKIKIYPNPTQDYLYIEHLSDNKTINIQILNTQGKIIKQIKTTNKKTVVNTANFSKGFYIIQIKNNRYKIIKK